MEQAHEGLVGVWQLVLAVAEHFLVARRVVNAARNAVAVEETQRAASHQVGQALLALGQPAFEFLACGDLAAQFGGEGVRHGAVPGSGRDRRFGVRVSAHGSLAVQGADRRQIMAFEITFAFGLGGAVSGVFSVAIAIARGRRGFHGQTAGPTAGRPLVCCQFDQRTSWFL